MQSVYLRCTCTQATLAKFLGTAVEAGMPQLSEEGPTSVGTAGQVMHSCLLIHVAVAQLAGSPCIFNCRRL